MCGITGIFDTRGKRDIDRAVLHRMNESQFHRGPDEGGLHIEPGVGLGHRRLSIIDLSTGQQPLYNEDQSRSVSSSTAKSTTIRNSSPNCRRWATSSTPAATPKSSSTPGRPGATACVNRFRGMFAFALWDRNRETLFLARDRLGVKPLFYALLDDGTFLFGSELKSLLAHGGLKRDIDPCAVEEYFALGYVAEPRAIFKQAKKLPPACTLLLRRGQPVGEPREYWDVHFTLDNPISDADACAELTHRLEESIKLRMISEVPLGAFLSGGVDSSAVVAIMAGLSNTAVNTCSIGFSDPAFNESEFAKMVADRYQTNHYLDMVESDDFDLIDTLATALRRTLRRQFGHPHLPRLPAGSQARHRGPVRRWRRRELRRLPPLPAAPDGRKNAFGLAARRCVGRYSASLGKIYPKADWAPRVFRAKTTFEGMARTSVEAYFHSVSILRAPMRNQLFSQTI